MPECRDPIIMAEKVKASVAECNSTALKRSIHAAIRRQATAWGVRFDQAQALLLDRKAIA